MCKKNNDWHPTEFGVVKKPHSVAEELVLPTALATVPVIADEKWNHVPPGDSYRIWKVLRPSEKLLIAEAMSQQI